MDQETRLGSVPMPSSDESALDDEKINTSNHPNLPTLQPSASSGQHCQCNAAYFLWPTSSRLSDAAEERANYFSNLQKGDSPETLGCLPEEQRATTLLDLMTIRAFHSKILRCYSLGTAIGFRIKQGVLTNIPAIIVFVSRKVHKQWLSPIQCLPTVLEGPGGIWCDVDVVEFSYFGAPEPTPKEQLYTEIVDDLRGSDPFIGSGSQVASQETYGTLGAVVRSQTGNRQVGFLTNRHVAVNLDFPSQKMFHPLPPTLGPGIYLGAVERATSFITDDLWYGIFAGTNPGIAKFNEILIASEDYTETFVRADGAFIPFSDDFEMSRITTSVKGMGEINNVKVIDLQSPIGSLIGKQVMKVGRSSGLTTGTVLAYALEYNDEKGICFLTDFLVVGENQQTFDLEGDSGSLIVMKCGDENRSETKPWPIGIIWGGTASRGRLKLKVGRSPENWTTGVDLGRLLSHLQLDLVTTEEGLKGAVQEQQAALTTAMDSMVADSSPPDINLQQDKTKEDKFDPTPGGGLQIQNIPHHEQAEPEFQLQDRTEPCCPPSVEHQFIPSFTGQLISPLHHKTGQPETVLHENLTCLKNGNGCDEDISVGLNLGGNGTKRRRSQVAEGENDEGRE